MIMSLSNKKREAIRSLQKAHKEERRWIDSRYALVKTLIEHGLITKERAEVILTTCILPPVRVNIPHGDANKWKVVHALFGDLEQVGINPRWQFSLAPAGQENLVEVRLSPKAEHYANVIRFTTERLLTPNDKCKISNKLDSMRVVECER
jgi:hypothetical protein